MMTPSSMKDQINVFTINYYNMLKNTAVLCVICILLCFNFNYTFPYHRGSSEWHLFRGNHSHHCVRHDNTIRDSKKRNSLNIENALKIITKDDSEHKNENRKLITEKNDNLSHFEQMVIMKKNPYLDLKELVDQKYYYSPLKNVRQSVAGSIGDPGICEPADEGPYVEITNRGLTGFAIPVKLAKAAVAITNAREDKLKPLEDVKDPTIAKRTDYDDKLIGLAKDIKRFEESKLLVNQKNQRN